MLKSSAVYSVKGFEIKTPALFISTSIRPNRDTAVSTILAAVAGSPMSPSTGATFSVAANGFALVMFREFATTLYPRSRNASTSPAPIPREAPVIIDVLVVFAICKLRLPISSHELQNAGRDVVSKIVRAMGADTRAFLGEHASVGAH